MLSDSSPAKLKLATWQQVLAASALHNSSTWHATATLARCLRRWELRFLRKILRLRRRPNEQQQQYMQRSSNMIDAWYRRFGFLKSHHVLLRNIFRSAWSESHRSLDSGCKPLLDARLCRDRMWWNSIKDLPHRLRVNEGCSQRTSGEKPSWEDPFVLVFGLDWRHRLRSCQSESEWKQYELVFINTLCARWSLPKLFPTCVSENATREVRVQRPKYVLPSAESLVIPKTCMPKSSGRLVFVVDCQPLSMIVGGHTPLRSTTLRPVFTRICRNLGELVQHFELGTDDADDPVHWVPRGDNQLADSLCNYTMDIGRSWTHQWGCSNLSSFCHSYVCFSDGGRRSQTSAASAWAICTGILSHGKWTFNLLMAGGIFHAGDVSSFTAEAIALQEAITSAQSLNDMS